MTDTKTSPSESPITNLLLGGPGAGSRLGDVMLLGARMYAGITIAKAGWDKLPVPAGMVEQVEAMGWFPAEPLFALAACLTEFAGGVLLAAGLFTRPVALLLAFTLGAAAFSFHGVRPVLDMHITQHFFWLYMVSLALGAGRYSFDDILRGVLRPTLPGGRPRVAPVAIAGGLSALVPVVIGLYLNFGPGSNIDPWANNNEPVGIEAVSIAGSFNDWDLTAHPLTRANETTWSAAISIEQAGPVMFKFAANGGWDFNLGENDPGTAGFPVGGTGEPDGENITVYIPAPGNYHFVVDVESYRYRVTPDEEVDTE